MKANKRWWVIVGVLALVALAARKAIEARRVRKANARWPRSQAFRSQPRGRRRRLGRACHRLHRCGAAREGDPRREAPHGRRLPEHRLRALEGADPLGQVPVAREAGAGVRHSRGACGIRVRRRDGTSPACDPDHRTARLGRAFHRTRHRRGARQRTRRLAVGGGDHRRRRAGATADDPQHRSSPPARAPSCRRSQASTRSRC